MRGVLGKEDELSPRESGRAASRLANVVVAVDGSEAARDAIAFAARLAANFGSRLHLVHAVAGLSCGPPSSVIDETRFSESFAFAQQCVAAERTWRPHGPASSVECVRMGRTVDAVISVAQERGAELIVTGTRDRAGTRRIDGESTAGEIIRRATVPVLVVHEGASLPASGAWLFRRPLVAVDYTDASAAALRTAAILAEGHAIDALRMIASDPAPSSDLASRYARSGAMTSERARLEQWIRASLDGDRAPSRAVVGVGAPEAAIVDFAVGGGYDLVACGTHARSGASNGRLGSVADALLDAVKAPVLVLREATGGRTS